MEGGDEKAIYLIRESFDDSVCKRGMASAVSFQKEVFLLTSSSVVKEVKPNEKPKKLIAQRFSRRKFGAYQAEVSIYRTIDEFTFLKIDKECEFSNVDKGWSTSHRNFDVSAPSSETKALATSPFCESLRQQVKPVAFECNGNNTIIEVIPETPIERTSILGAPIFLETKTTYTMKGDKFKVIGVVGLSSEEKLCSYYLNHNILDLVSSKQKEMQSKRKGGIVKTPIEQDHPSGSEDVISIKGMVKETMEPGQEIPQKSSQHIEEETDTPGPRIIHNKLGQFGKGEPAEVAARSFNKLPPLTNNFIGREEVVKEIVSKLTRKPDPFRMVVLLSIPGEGKTQTAIKVGHELLEYSKLVIFIEKQESLAQLCIEIICGISGRYISGSNDLVFRAKEKLKAFKGDVCIILDNTENMQEKERMEFDSFVNFVVEKAPAIQLIITTQKDVGFTSLNVHKQHLKPLDNDSSIHLIQRSVSITDKDAKEIGELCGGIPLLLAACAALLKESFSTDTLIQWLKQNVIQFLQDKAEDVYNALCGFLGRMRKPLLQNLIKLSVFPSSFSVKDISQIHFNDNELESEKVKTTMVGFSLLQRMGHEKYALHPLVREYCRANLKNLPDTEEVGQSAQDKFDMHFIEKLKTLSKEFITKDSAMGAISSFRAYRANIMEALSNHLDEKSSADKKACGVDVAISTEVLDLLSKVSLSPAECLKFYQRCYGIAKDSGDQMRLANSLNALGFRHLCDVSPLKPNQLVLDKFTEAKGIYEKLSKEQQNCEAYAQILCKLGLCLCLQGEEKEKGLDLIHEGITLKEKLGVPVYLAAGHCDLGNAHYTLGDHQKAIDVWEKKTLPIYQDELGEHPWTASILHFIARSYMALAKTKVDGAVNNCRDALALRKKLLRFHQDTARSHILLSDALVELQNDFESAYEELKEAFKIQKEVLGENHSSTKDTEAKMMRIASMRVKGTDQVTGQATSSVGPSESEEATSVKDSVEETTTSVTGPAITPSKPGLFGKGTEKCEIRNRPHQSTRREEVDAPLTNHAELNRPSNNFRITLLSKRTSCIRHKFYDEICTALDQDHPLGYDYNLLGEYIGLKKGKVAVLSQNGNPTKLLMQTLDTQKDGTIRRFKEILEKMNRHDVLLIIEDWIKHEWNDPQRINKLVF
ncbi:uncharacterized protein LOC141879324 isoform X3 [Acropora palmata]|uniref:uncharacterized protein LOC141879324 isoform X3 n=1 Tax=Acropora palmata TaxID=6131 RepID=UPI003DA14E17